MMRRKPSKELQREMQEAFQYDPDTGEQIVVLCVAVVLLSFSGFIK